MTLRNTSRQSVDIALEGAVSQAYSIRSNSNVRVHEKIQLLIATNNVPDMRLSHTLLRQRRTPCFPQIDLALRAILYEKRPRFVVLFSHQTTSYSQIFFTHPSYVPDEDIFYDYPTGCPNPCCTDDCEMIRFPSGGPEAASILQIKTKGRHKRFKARDMCNWIDCDISFGGIPVQHISTGGSSDGSDVSVEPTQQVKVVDGHLCSKCKLVKYCSPEHQKKDWDEHRRVCVKM
jgi:hypothetical protein